MKQTPQLNKDIPIEIQTTDNGGYIIEQKRPECGLTLRYCYESYVSLSKALARLYDPSDNTIYKDIGNPNLPPFKSPPPIRVKPTQEPTKWGNDDIDTSD